MVGYTDAELLLTGHSWRPGARYSVWNDELAQFVIAQSHQDFSAERGGGIEKPDLGGTAPIKRCLQYLEDPV